MQKRQSIRGRPAGTISHEAELAAAFGSAVRAIREARNLAQEDLANLADIERSHMGKLERGQHMPTLALVFKIANALGLAPGMLIDGTELHLRGAYAGNVPAPRRRIARKTAKPEADPQT